MNVVKEVMGHADISTTAEFYSAVSKEHEDQAQWVIEAMTVGANRNKTDARGQNQPNSEGWLMHTSGDNYLPDKHFCQKPPDGLEPSTCGLQKDSPNVRSS